MDLAISRVISNSVEFDAASTTPIEGRNYMILGRAVDTDSLIYLFGFIPVSGMNHTSDSINAAIRKNSDEMFNVTVEGYRPSRFKACY